MKQSERLVVFIIAVSLALVNKYFINVGNTGVLSTFMNWYFNDIVGACGYCSYCDYASVLFTEKSLTRYSLFLLILISGIVWEYITPMFREDTISDVYDIVAYIIGAGIYIVIRNVFSFVQQRKIMRKTMTK